MAINPAGHIEDLLCEKKEIKTVDIVNRGDNVMGKLILRRRVRFPRCKYGRWVQTPSGEWLVVSSRYVGTAGKRHFRKVNFKGAACNDNSKIQK